MKYLILILYFSSSYLLYSQTYSDSVEYTHIYISDTSKVIKKCKEAKDYVNPFSPITYFSVQIPRKTKFKLTICDSNDSDKISYRKIIFQDSLEIGNYRIEDENLISNFHGIYYFQVDISDSTYFRRVIITKWVFIEFVFIREIGG